MSQTPDTESDKGLGAQDGAHAPPQEPRARAAGLTFCIQEAFDAVHLAILGQALIFVRVLSERVQRN